MIFGETYFVVEGIFLVSKDGEIFFLFFFDFEVSLSFFLRFLRYVEGFSVPSLSVEC